jgi:pilus assembly protein CpaE
VKNLRTILVGPDEERRKAVLAAISEQPVTLVAELKDYSAVRQLKPGVDDWDVALLDLDSDPDLCLAVVQSISGKSAASTVMVCSASEDPELLMRCMWAGAREFLRFPITPHTLTEALLRAVARLAESTGTRRSGKLLVFVGAKGGAGVTTIATNLALALRQETGAEVVLLDLDIELGESSLLLGLKPSFTLLDVVKNSKRLDRELLSGLLAKHESGLVVMAGPDEYEGPTSFDNGDLTKLLYLLREQFAYVVVDAGPNLGRSAGLLMELAESIYVVSQADIPGLRNAQRYVSHIQRFGREKVRLVMNRYDPRRHEIEEERIVKAVGVPVAWKVPNDYAAVHRSHNTAVPLVQGDSPVARMVRQMAREACGKRIEPVAKKGLGLFR